MTPTKILIGQVFIVAMIIAAAMWIATGYVAGVFHYDAALGTPWFTALGRPVYYPWRLFEWWYAYEPYAPGVFLRGGAIAASGGFIGAGVAIGGSVWRARQQKNVTTYGSARWAEARDIVKANLLKTQGVFLGAWNNRYLRHDGPEHVMAFAPTRSGKGVGLVVPTLLSWTGSAVIHDIKGENWRLTAGWRSKFSHCLLFNPTDPNSARYNPLLEVRKGLFEVRDAQNIADILIDPDGTVRRDHWDKTAYALLLGVILHVLYAEKEKTLSRIANFLSEPSRSFKDTLKIMMTTNHLGTADNPKAHPTVAHGAQEAMNKWDNELSGVLSTVMTTLSLYRDPIIDRITGVSDWQVADLVNARNPVSLYLVVPPSDISRTRPLMRLILNQIGRRLTEELESDATKNRRQLLLMLDEFPALGRLDFFESALAYLAGYGVRAYLIAQSLNQIEKAYGPNNSILDNCHVRVAFAANDERTAKRISDALGTATEIRSQRNYAGHRLALWLSHVMVSRQETARPLLTPGEVMQLPPDDALAMIAGAPPIRAKKVRYFSDAAFNARRLDPPEIIGADGAYADAPPSPANDWDGMIATTHEALDVNWEECARNQKHGKAGGFKKEFDPTVRDDIAPASGIEIDGVDDADAAFAARLRDIAETATTRAAVMDKHPRSILPSM